MKKTGIDLRTGTAVVKITEADHSTLAHFSDGSVQPFGLMVWSVGLAKVNFVKHCELPMNKQGRIIVDEYLRVQGVGGGRIFALGDCSSVEAKPLPPIASVAEQQGTYLTDCFNEHYKNFDVTDATQELPLPGAVAAPIGLPFPRSLYPRSATFRFYSVGAMASFGFGDGVVDLTHADVTKGFFSARIRGFMAMLVWRYGYLSKQLSWTNMILVPMYWWKSFLFGRDISRF